MSGRPNYLVILPHHGLFSAHWTEYDAFRAARKLRERREDPMVIEVPQSDGISVTWKLEIPECPDTTEGAEMA
jgi:hypothetical protein